MRTPSRRRLLAGLGSTTAALTLAGCLTDDGGDPGADDDATDTPTATPTARQTTASEDAGPVPALVDWVPTAEALETESVAYYHTDLAALRGMQDSLTADLYDSAVRGMVTGGRDPIVPDDRLQSAITIQNVRTVVVETDMSDDELGSAIVDAGFEQNGTQGEATLYVGAGDGRSPTTLAVHDGVMVRGLGSSVRTVVDAAAGDAARLADENDDVATLYERTPDAQIRVLGTEPAAAVGGGENLLSGAETLVYAWELGSDETTFTATAVYPEGDTPPTADFTTYIEEDATPVSYSDFEGAADGRLVTTTGSLPTEEFSLFGGGGSNTGSGDTEAPQATFGFEYDEEAETVTIVHEGGGSIEASRLTIDIEGIEGSKSFAEDGETITAGSSVTVDVSGAPDEAEIRLVWSGPDDRTQVIAMFMLP
ncbi:hypothetical protein [Haloarchaeobius iranensis]|uniref:Uncharacterized protein n=1 Tax=Haloarchaeobius iranensis TaxID=996166 RepID=A0A1G9VUL9_9EURY|nr:hypothetical protein [Haloarchaeobius iranensis]SDM75938.1 hypothetical protein SAMN05192554_10713 [Haloarchaeobius iranensis]